MGNFVCIFINRKILLLSFGIFWFGIICTNVLNVLQYTSTTTLLFNKDSSAFTLIIDPFISTQQSQSNTTTKAEDHNDQNAEQVILMKEEHASSVGAKAKDVPADIPISNSTSSTITPVDAAAGTVPHQPSIASERQNDHTSSSLPNFQRYEGVVIVTKVLTGEDAEKVGRMLCFLQHAYNDRTQYDIVVFTTMPWDEQKISNLQKVVAPTKLTVAVEGPPLEEQIAAMTPEEKEFLYKRCNVAAGKNITWFNYCTEEGSNNISNLGYAWQAEFRSYHIWNHDAIKGYKYMMWFDSDALVGRSWDKDPMQLMVEKDLVILFATFPYGILRHPLVKEKMENTYKKSICKIYSTKEKTLYPHFCDEKHSLKMTQIGGYHHITNLEVYRKPIHQKFLKDFVGDYRFSRLYDDQIAVTIPAIMEQDMSPPGIPRVVGELGSFADMDLRIAHHGRYGGKRGEYAPSCPDGMFKNLKDSWPGLEERCGKYF